MLETPELTTLGQIMALPENGDFLQRFMGDHADLIQAMHTHQMNNGGKVKASFTIKVDYVLDKGLTLSMQAEATIKKPKPPAATAVAWTTPDGMLTPQNPKQMAFELRDVTAPQPAIRY